ncbi:MAG: protein kinase [Woeseia sp.]|nr:protein kinase [Woeseia sp.]NNL55163.1 protein kinase [Woeseia sp.]
MNAQNLTNRDRLIALGFVSLLLVVMYGPAASFFVGADRFVYDQLAGRLVTQGVPDGIVVTVDPEGKSAADIAAEYGQVLARIRSHDSRRIIMTQPPAMAASEELPAWAVELRDGPPVFVPSRHPLAAISSASGIFEIVPDADGILRRSNLWFLDGSSVSPSLSPSLALAIALASSDGLPAADMARNDAAMFIGGHRAMPSLSSEDLRAGRYSGADLRDKTVFVDASPEKVAAAAQLPSGQFVTSSELVAAMLGSIEAGVAITSPSWAGVMQILTPALFAVLAIMLLPGHSRRGILLTTVIAVVVLLVAQAALLKVAHLRFDLGRPIVVLVSAAIVVAWLARNTNLQSVSGNALRRGNAFLAAGRLEPAFAELRRCNPSDELANAMYKLSMAFEEKAKPERAEAVLSWMQKAQDTFSRTRHPADDESAAARATDAFQAAETGAPAESSPTTSNSGANALMQTSEIPQQLGRYVIERKIGKGAMGAVYLARDPRINRAIALKVIAIEKEFEDEELKEARERFFLEAESAGRLAHPYIITVYDCGEDKHLAYIAMEYLQGTPLTFFKDPKKLLAPRKALELAARTAEGLDYAHNQGVIHRDIKPANLLYNAREDVLKISDFGVARLTDNNRTKTGIVLGTPMYMSPEQLSAEELTGHSDLFSLGVTLYELLTGEVPFKATNIAVLMKKITTEDPEPVSNRRPGIPPSVDAVLFRALAKRPEERFANGAELAVALRNCAKYAST